MVFYLRILFYDVGLSGVRSPFYDGCELFCGTQNGKQTELGNGVFSDFHSFDDCFKGGGIRNNVVHRVRTFGNGICGRSFRTRRNEVRETKNVLFKPEKHYRVALRVCDNVCGSYDYGVVFYRVGGAPYLLCDNAF